MLRRTLSQQLERMMGRRGRSSRLRSGRQRAVSQAMEALETRQMLTTLFWDGGGDGTNWSDAANWDDGGLNPAAAPGIGDSAVISLAGSGVYTVRIDVNTEVDQLTLDSPDATLSLTGTNLVVNGAASLSQGKVFQKNSSFQADSISNAISFDIRDGVTIDSADFQQNGTLLIQATGSVSSGAAHRGELTLPQGLVNRGLIRIKPHPVAGFDSLITISGGKLINESDGTVQLETGFSGADTEIGGDFDNFGTVDVFNAGARHTQSGEFVNFGTFHLHPNAQWFSSTGVETFRQAAGTMTIDGDFEPNNDVFQFDGGTVINNDLILLGGSSVVNLNGGVMENNASWRVASGGIVNFVGGQIVGNDLRLEGSDLNITGVDPYSFRIASIGTSDVSGRLAVGQTLTVDNIPANFADGFIIGGTLQSAGPNVSGSKSVFNSPGTLIIEPTGVLRVDHTRETELNASFINDGSIEINQFSEWFNDNTLVNRGSVVVASGGSLTSTNSTNRRVEHRDGLIQIADPGGWNVTADFEYLGGDIDGIVRMRSSARLTIDSASGASGIFDLAGGVLASDVFAGQTILVQNATTGATFATDVVNAGTIQLVNSTGNGGTNLQLGSNSLTNAAGGVITMNASGDGSTQIFGDMLNLGELRIESGVGRTVGNTINRSEVSVSSNATYVPSGFFQEAGSVVANGRFQTSRTGGSVVYSGGTIEGRVTVNSGQLEIAPTVPAGAEFQFISSGTLASDIPPGITVVFNAIQTSQPGLYNTIDSLTNHGVLRLGSDDTVGTGVALTIGGGKTVTNGPGGLVEIVGTAGTRQLSGLIVNQGLLAVDRALRLSASTGSTHFNSGTIRLNDLLDATNNNLVQTSEGLLTGNGTVKVSSNGLFTNNGIIAPGIPAGGIQITGNLELGEESRIQLDITGQNPTSNFDTLNVTGSATLNGTLSIATATEFTPAVGTEFAIVQAAQISGSFGAVTTSGNGSVAYGVRTNPNDVTLEVVSSFADLSAIVNAVPSSAVATEVTTIEYTVLNQGNTTSATAWNDRLYLSPTATFDPVTARLIADRPHVGSLANGASYTETITAQLPAVLPGEYHIIVLTDSRFQTGDADRENNFGVSPSLTISVAELPIGVPQQFTIAAGESKLFQLPLSAGADVIVSSDAEVAATNELMTRSLAVPSPEAFDQRAFSSIGDFNELRINDAQAGPHFVLVKGRAAAGSGRGITLLAAPVTFAVGSLAPDSGSNAGNVTITIVGDQFSSNTDARLRTSDGSEVNANSIQFINENRIAATFDLSNLSPGVLDLEVVDNGRLVSVSNAFTVSEAAEGRLVTQLNVPNAIRSGRTAETTVNASNVGHTDLPARLMQIVMRDGRVRLPDQTEFSDDVLEFLVIDSSGNVGVLPPGFSQVTTFKTSSFGSNRNMQTSLLTPALDSVLDHDAVKEDLRPSTIDPTDWEAIFTVWKLKAGSTVADYQQLLADSASELQRLGIVTADVAKLRAFAFIKAGADLDLAQQVETATVNTSELQSRLEALGRRLSLDAMLRFFDASGTAGLASEVVSLTIESETVSILQALDSQLGEGFLAALTDTERTQLREAISVELDDTNVGSIESSAAVIVASILSDDLGGLSQFRNAGLARRLEIQNVLAAVRQQDAALIDELEQDDQSAVQRGINQRLSEGEPIATLLQETSENVAAAVQSFIAANLDASVIDVRNSISPAFLGLLDAEALARLDQSIRDQLTVGTSRESLLAIFSDPNLTLVDLLLADEIRRERDIDAFVEEVRQRGGAEVLDAFTTGQMQEFRRIINEALDAGGRFLVPERFGRVFIESRQSGSFAALEAAAGQLAANQTLEQVANAGARIVIDSLDFNQLDQLGRVVEKTARAVLGLPLIQPLDPVVLAEKLQQQSELPVRLDQLIRERIADDLLPGVLAALQQGDGTGLTPTQLRELRDQVAEQIDPRTLDTRGDLDVFDLIDGQGNVDTATLRSKLNADAFDRSVKQLVEDAVLNNEAARERFSNMTPQEQQIFQDGVADLNREGAGLDSQDVSELLGFIDGAVEFADDVANLILSKRASEILDAARENPSAVADLEQLSDREESLLKDLLKDQLQRQPDPEPILEVLSIVELHDLRESLQQFAAEQVVERVMDFLRADPAAAAVIDALSDDQRDAFKDALKEHEEFLEDFDAQVEALREIVLLGGLADDMQARIDQERAEEDAEIILALNGVEFDGTERDEIVRLAIDLIAEGDDFNDVFELFFRDVALDQIAAQMREDIDRLEVADEVIDLLAEDPAEAAVLDSLSTRQRIELRKRIVNSLEEDPLLDLQSLARIHSVLRFALPDHQRLLQRTANLREADRALVAAARNLSVQQSLDSLTGEEFDELRQQVTESADQGQLDREGLTDRLKTTPTEQLSIELQLAVANRALNTYLGVLGGIPGLQQVIDGLSDVSDRLRNDVAAAIQTNVAPEIFGNVLLDNGVDGSRQLLLQNAVLGNPDDFLQDVRNAGGGNVLDALSTEQLETIDQQARQINQALADLGATQLIHGEIHSAESVADRFQDIGPDQVAAEANDAIIDFEAERFLQSNEGLNSGFGGIEEDTKQAADKLSPELRDQLERFVRDAISLGLSDAEINSLLQGDRLADQMQNLRDQRLTDEIIDEALSNPDAAETFDGLTSEQQQELRQQIEDDLIVSSGFSSDEILVDQTADSVKDRLQGVGSGDLGAELDRSAAIRDAKQLVDNLRDENADFKEETDGLSRDALEELFETIRELREEGASDSDIVDLLLFSSSTSLEEDLQASINKRIVDSAVAAISSNSEAAANIAQLNEQQRQELEQELADDAAMRRFLARAVGQPFSVAEFIAAVVQDVAGTRIEELRTSLDDRSAERADNLFLDQLREIDEEIVDDLASLEGAAAEAASLLIREFRESGLSPEEVFDALVSSDPAQSLESLVLEKAAVSVADAALAEATAAPDTSAVADALTDDQINELINQAIDLANIGLLTGLDTTELRNSVVSDITEELLGSSIEAIQNALDEAISEREVAGFLRDIISASQELRESITALDDVAFDELGSVLRDFIDRGIPVSTVVDFLGESDDLNAELRESALISARDDVLAEVLSDLGAASAFGQLTPEQREQLKNEILTALDLLRFVSDFLDNSTLFDEELIKLVIEVRSQLVDRDLSELQTELDEAKANRELVAFTRQVKELAENDLVEEFTIRQNSAINVLAREVLEFDPATQPEELASIITDHGTNAADFLDGVADSNEVTEFLDHALNDSEFAALFDQLGALAKNELKELIESALFGKGGGLEAAQEVLDGLLILGPDAANDALRDEFDTRKDAEQVLEALDPGALPKLSRVEQRVLDEMIRERLTAGQSVEELRREIEADGSEAFVERLLLEDAIRQFNQMVREFRAYLDSLNINLSDEELADEDRRLQEEAQSGKSANNVREQIEGENSGEGIVQNATEDEAEFDQCAEEIVADVIQSRASSRITGDPPNDKERARLKAAVKKALTEGPSKTSLRRNLNSMPVQEFDKLIGRGQADNQADPVAQIINAVAGSAFVSFLTRVALAIDPNEIIGPEGFGADGFLRGEQPLGYTIHFENLATASAAAQEVTITQQLDEDFDFTSFSLGSFGFGDFIVDVPAGLDRIETRIDARDTTGLFVDVAAGIDLQTGLATWSFRSIDPATGDFTADPFAGFLPPNVVPGDGEGFVSYVVSPQSNLPSGTRLDAEAEIIFDLEAPLNTPAIFNTIDAGPPVATVNALPVETSTAELTVNWSAQDDVNGSGVASFDLFVAEDNGPFQLLFSGLTSIEADFVGRDNHRYDFFVVATDNVGRSSDAVPVSQAFTTLRINDVPQAADDTARLEEDSIVVIDVLTNDFDVDGDLLLTTIETPAQNGTAAVTPEGVVTYTPAADFHGVDEFTYSVSDGRGGVSTARVQVIVVPVNDAPIALDDSAATDEDQSVTINVLANDSDIELDTLTAILSNGPANGTVALNLDQTFTYTPHRDFHGIDSFTYAIRDASGADATAVVAVQVTPTNDRPVARNDQAVVSEDSSVVVSVLTNDSDVDGDTLSIALLRSPANGLAVLNLDGTITYTPDADFHGTDVLLYQTLDNNGGVTTARLDITVSPVNDTPVATDDSVTTDEDNAVTISVLSNDSDVDGDPLIASIATGPANGSATVNADGTISYTPNANFNGGDSFTYTVNDGNGGSATATVNITVSAVNDNPVVTILDAPTNETEGTLIRLASNIIDPDAGDSHTLTWSVLRNGEAFANGAGSTIEFTPVDDGSYVVSVAATDLGGLIATDFVAIAVGNVAPTVSITGPDSVTAGESATFTLTAIDPGSVDQLSNFTFAIDWDGDGTVDETLVGPSGSTISRVFTEEGDTDILVTATDKDGAKSDVAILSIDVVRGGGGGQPGTAALVNGDLVVTGTDDNDHITIRPDRRNPGHVKVRINRADVGSFAPTGVITVDAGLGNDEVYVSRDLLTNAIIDGGPGNDFLRGGGGNDLLRGGDGNDELQATTGDDTLEGGSGNDLLRAGKGNDILRGDEGNDELRGDEGSDLLDGGSGHDLLIAGNGRDTLLGGPGSDVIFAGNNGDTIFGGDGNDVIHGGRGNDVVDAGPGHDIIYDDHGDDILMGGDGNDLIIDRRGDNILLGGSGNDTILGGRGRDLIIGGAGRDLLFGGDDEDLLIGGETEYDNDQHALNLILSEWTRSTPHRRRRQHIMEGTGRLSGTGIRLNSQTVHEDEERDLLFGGCDLDLVFEGVLDDVLN